MSLCCQVGSSGSGKSTLAALLLRLYDPQQGNVLLDGVPVSNYDPAWLRSHIGAVSQVAHKHINVYHLCIGQVPYCFNV